MFSASAGPATAPRILVVYPAHDEALQQAATRIARRCGADLERIRERHEVHGPWHRLRALLGATPAIRAPRRAPEDYDLVILGTPARGPHGVAPALDAYLRTRARRLPRVAFFCTEARRGHDATFATLQRLCGQAPVATLAVPEGAQPAAVYSEPLRRFVTRLGVA